MAMAGGLLTASAQDYQYMILQRKDGSTLAVRSSGLSMTVSGGSLIVKSGEETKSIDISTLRSMKFAADLSGVAVISADGSDVEAFTTSGLSIGRYKSADEAMKGISTPGIYILKGSGSTIKVLIEK